MNKGYTLNFTICFIILTALYANVLCQEEGDVGILFVGMVVDNKGVPIKNAHVTIVPDNVCSDCIDQLFTGYTTNDKGKFMAGDDGYLNNDKVALVVSVPSPKGLWSPVYWYNLVNNFRKFSRTFHIDEECNVFDLGKITPDLVYKKVAIDTKKLFKTTYLSIVDRKIRISIFHDGKQVIKQKKVPDYALDKKTGNINFALPEGVWLMKLEISIDGTYQSKTILINNVETNVEISVVTPL